MTTKIRKLFEIQGQGGKMRALVNEDMSGAWVSINDSPELKLNREETKKLGEFLLNGLGIAVYAGQTNYKSGPGGP